MALRRGCPHPTTNPGFVTSVGLLLAPLSGSPRRPACARPGPRQLYALEPGVHPPMLLSSTMVGSPMGGMKRGGDFAL
eukprot:4061811-Alexandrium_andersonii.AAC.1